MHLILSTVVTVWSVHMNPQVLRCDKKTDDRQHRVKRSPLTTKVSLLEGRKHENREENLPLLDGKYIGKMLKTTRRR